MSTLGEIIYKACL